MHSEKNESKSLYSVLEFLKEEGIDIDDVNSMFGAFDLLTDWLVLNAANKTLIANGGGPIRELATYLNRDALEQLVIAYSRYLVHLGGKR